MWNRAERRGRAASRIVRSTKSSSPAGLAYTAVLPKEAPLLYCTPSGLSIAPPSRDRRRPEAGPPATGALPPARSAMSRPPGAPAHRERPCRASLRRTRRRGRAGSGAGGPGDGRLVSEDPQSGLLHQLDGGLCAREQEELRGGLRHEHLESVDDVVPPRARLAEKPGPGRVVDDVVDPGGGDPGGRQRGPLSVRRKSDGGGVDQDIARESPQSIPGKMPDSEGPRQIAAASGRAVEQRDPASLGGKTVDQGARRTPGAHERDAGSAQRHPAAQRKKSRLHVGVV